ncbi:hypothetical protein K438DRAFT_2027691 [Mycena galopus ATCC 62051]|nr:hypothetical protein K438DRAFT_2027691 [Mycena galopus ATCC 62051]
MESEKMEPVFPPDLEHEIFRTTATLHAGMIPTLLRVARRVREWTEPLLYTVLRISPGETKDAYSEALLRALNDKSPDFFPNTTRRLTLSTMTMTFFGERIENPWSASELERMLYVCTGITELLVFGNLLEPPVLRLLADARPTRLDLVGNIFRVFSEPECNFALPLFQHVSHLYLCDIDDEVTPTWVHWTALSHLPALTHLAVIRMDHIPTILATLPTLDVVLLYGIDDNDALPNDRRIVVAEPDDFWSDWHQGVDIWRQVDVFLARKGSGDIPESCYQLDFIPPVEIPALDNS